VASIRFISIGEEYWETNYLTGEWWQCPTGQCFNPAILFDPQFGLQPILEADLTDVRLEANEELEEMPGKWLYVLSGTLQGERIAQMSWGLLGPQSMAVNLWVIPETFDLYRIRLEEPAPPGGEATLWVIDFLNFDRPAAILPPATPTP
jgi:lipoprotein LprG